MCTNLINILDKDKVSFDYLRRLSVCRDASVYRLVPTAVVYPSKTSDITALFKHCIDNKTHLGFRTAGTSLSGQGVTGGILVDLSKNWHGISIIKNGNEVRVKPGSIGSFVNDALYPYAKKIGPDPASIQVAMMGGILANNSSGMCCGVENNAYQTLQAMTIILTNGAIISTDSPNAQQEFSIKQPEIHNGIIAIKNKIQANSILAKKIKQKYLYKNTTGYGLNAFLDFDNSLDILMHLMIGSEGTLGFIAEAVLKTIPIQKFSHTGMLFFDNITDTTEAIKHYNNLGAAAIELMDRAALRSVEDQASTPSLIKELPNNAIALLIEFQTNDANFAIKNLAPFAGKYIEKIAFTNVKNSQEKLWKMRKGILPSVGAARPAQTAIIIEDIVLPPENLAAGIRELQNLFSKHAYNNAIIFGHAKDGNLHFVISQSYNHSQEIERYKVFIEDVVALVVKYNGALKGEHGTGRNMAPFVEAEWGSEATQIMWDIKKLLDPHNILNPDVVLSASPNIHLQNLKTIPTVNKIIDSCMECGYCEAVCPSEKLTLSPRKRIILSRELQNTDAPNASQMRQAKANFNYQAINSCVADGLCSHACPVNINTGEYIKYLRALNNNSVTFLIAKYAEQNFALLEYFTKIMIQLAATCKLVDLPNQPIYNKNNITIKPIAILFPSCVTRMMSPLSGNATANYNSANLLALAKRAQVYIALPTKLQGLCCGLPFFSKGFIEAGVKALSQIINMFYLETNAGELPVIIDNSPCTHNILEHQEHLPEDIKNKLAKIKIIDLIEFLHDSILPKLSIQKTNKTIHIFPVCSVTIMGLTPKLQAIASSCGPNVELPIRPSCCGQGGDRGIYYPKLTKAATQKIEWRSPNAEEHYTTSKTCAVSLSKNLEAEYTSVVDLLLRYSE